MKSADALLRTAATIADEKKAQDVIALDVREPLVITDYFLIMSGRSTRQVKELANSIREALADRGAKPLGSEGEQSGRWVLLDYGDLVVHIFTDEERSFYEIERLWKDAPRVDWKKRGSK